MDPTYTPYREKKIKINNQRKLARYIKKITDQPIENPQFYHGRFLETQLIQTQDIIVSQQKPLKNKYKEEEKTTPFSDEEEKINYKTHQQKKNKKNKK